MWSWRKQYVGTQITSGHIWSVFVADKQWIWKYIYNRKSQWSSFSCNRRWSEVQKASSDGPFDVVGIFLNTKKQQLLLCTKRDKMAVLYDVSIQPRDEDM